MGFSYRLAPNIWNQNVPTHRFQSRRRIEDFAYILFRTRVSSTLGAASERPTLSLSPRLKGLLGLVPHHSYTLCFLVRTVRHISSLVRTLTLLLVAGS